VSTSTKKRRSRARSSKTRRQAALRAQQAVSPNRSLIAGVLVAAVVIGVWGLVASGVLRSGGSVVFWLAVVAAFVSFAAIGTRLVDRGAPLASARRLTVLATVAAVVVVFDPLSGDVFGITKLAVLIVGSVTALVLWLPEGRRGRRLRELSGLDWAVVGLVGWTVVATLLSSDRAMSFYGVRQTHMGLVTTLAFGAIYFAGVSAFERRHTYDIVRVLFYPLGGVVLLYGLLQLHDRVFGGSWDWVDWGATEFDERIWSTLGNPNHLGALLAMLLPLGIVLLRLERRPPMRLLAGLMLVVLLVQLVHTQSRGAWAAAAAVMVALTLSWRRHITRSPRTAVLVGVAALIAILGAVAFVEGSANLGEEVRTAFDTRTATNAQRLGQWKASVDMAQDRPLTGFGPDTFRIHWTEYQPADFVDRFGPYNMTDGSHSVFTDYLAMLGVPGLIALLALFVAAARAIRRAAVRKSEHGELDEPTSLLIAAIGAAALAFVVQAAFNLQQISLWAVFWILLVVIGLFERDSGAAMAEGRPTAGGRSARSSSQRRTGLALVGAAVVVATSMLAMAPWRAARHHRRAVLVAAAVEEDPDDARGPDAAAQAAREWDRAVDLNPLEPFYLDRSAAFWSFRATDADLGDPKTSLEEAVRDSARAVGRRPLSWELRKDEAAILRQVYRFAPNRDALEAAIEAHEKALARNPLDREMKTILAELRALQN
jgi:O-antigen ligase